MPQSRKKVTIGEALRLTMQNPQLNLGVLYLPEQQWTLDTAGMFVDFDKDYDPNVDQTPEEVKINNWRETLDTDLIDQVIFNARAQRPTVTMEELVEAFSYYFDRDAFLRFE